MTIKIELPTTKKKIVTKKKKNQKGYVENTQTDVLRKIRQKQKTKKKITTNHLYIVQKYKEIRKLYIQNKGA